MATAILVTILKMPFFEFQTFEKNDTFHGYKKSIDSLYPN